MYGAGHDLGEEHVLEALLGLDLVVLARHRLVVLVRLVEVRVRRLIILLLYNKIRNK